MGMGWGWGAPAVAGGVLAGALLGSALAAPYYYGPGPYYPYYPRPIMHPRPPAITLRAMSCARWERGRLLHATLQIIRSEERNLSRTDGHRHPCP